MDSHNSKDLNISNPVLQLILSFVVILFDRHPSKCASAVVSDVGATRAS